MELFYNSNYFIIKRSQSSLWFKRYDNVTNYEFKTGYDFSNLDDLNLKCLGFAYTLIGALTQDTLLFTVRNQFIGQIPDITDLNVYLIKKVALINLNSDFDNLINEFDLCPIHDPQNNPEQNDSQNDINLSNLSTNLSNVNVQTMQKTWNSIKQNTPMIKITNIGQRINEEILKLFNETDSFYYCENGDLTNNLQIKNSSQYLELVKQDLPFWKRTDKRFFFNEHLLNFLINNESSIDKTATWIQPIIQGFIEIVNCKANLIEGEPNEFKLILISRRSRFRAGTRFKRRGVDENGKVANYVETEQLIKFNQHVVSFVQVRGSIPVFWSQPGNAYRPTPILDRSLKESQIAFEKHFEEEFSIYDKVIAINLIERQGRESILGDAYLNCLLEFNNEKLSYVVFDFHSHCRGMKFTNVNLLIDNIQEQIKEQLFFWKDNDGVICKQTGIFRVNCVDCLDRTNLVQSSIAKFVLLTQMNKLALLAPDEPFAFNIRKAFQHIWANNGDSISRQYAGTSALKGDFTRTGERRFSGVMKDGFNSATAIDTLLGNPIIDLNDLPDQNNNDADEEEEDTERVKQIIEDVKMFCIPENEIILGSWSLISTISNEMDTILVLTKDNYYVVTYDEQRDRVSKCQCVSLEDIEKIELGPEQNSINQKNNYCIRIHYLFNSSTGYFHMFRSSNTRFFNNMVIMIKTSEDSIESLRSIVESFKIALSVKNISVPLFEGKLIPKKSKKPQAVYFARKINQQLQKLPRNISDNNLLRIKNVGRNYVSNQFNRFKNKFTGSTRSNINLPGDTVFESTINSSIDLRNNSYTSLSILKEDDNTDYVKTSLKPRLTDPSSITSTSSINALQYTTEEDERTATLSESGLSDSENDELDDSEISNYQNDNDEYSKTTTILQNVANDTLLESCGILTTTSTNKQQQKSSKSELSNYTKTLSQVDDFVFDSMKKTSLNQMLNQVKRKVNSPQIQITNQNDLNSSDYYLSSNSSVNFPTQNTVSCANLNNPTVIIGSSGGGNLNRRLSDNESTNKKNELSKNLNNEDCTRSTFDIYGSNRQRQNNSFSSTFANTFSASNLDGNLRSLLKSSKSEVPLNDINEQLNLSKILPTIGKRDLIFNPLNKITSFAKGIQNIGIISGGRRFIKLSNEELAELAEKKNKSKSLIIEID